MTKSLEALLKQYKVLQAKVATLEEKYNKLDSDIDDKCDVYREKLIAGLSKLEEENEIAVGKLTEIRTKLEKTAEKYGVCLNFD